MVFVIITLLLGLPTYLTSLLIEVPTVSHNTLLNEGAYSFTQEGADTYSALVYDEARKELIVGAKNHIFRLSTTLKKIDELELVPLPSEIQVCTFKNHKLSECQIFINYLCIFDEDLFIFGISAFARPFYQQRSAAKFSADVIPQITFKGDNRLPSNPHVPFAFITVQDKLFVGSSLDEDGEDIAIVLTNITDYKSDPIRTKKDESWLASPEFIGAFEDSDAVYFVFRELALEAPSLDDDDEDLPLMYSRVGRICKNDTGGTHTDTKGYFVSFTKARLLCEDHDVVTAVAYNAKQRMLYASFTDQDFKTVAVCLYAFSIIEKAFDGMFHYRDSKDKKWEDFLATDPSTVRRVEQTCFGPRALDETIHYHLMTDPITAYCNKSHFKTTARNGIIFNAIAFSKIKDFEVYFADSKGMVWNVTISACTANPVEMWEIEAAPDTVNVNSISVHDSIIVLTDAGVISIPFDRKRNTSSADSDHLGSTPGSSNRTIEHGRNSDKKVNEHDLEKNRKKSQGAKASSLIMPTSLSIFYFLPVYLMIHF